MKKVTAVLMILLIVGLALLLFYGFLFLRRVLRIVGAVTLLVALAVVLFFVLKRRFLKKK
ncbi:MAG: hypothetical protein FWG93_02095 [Oscillospiraceae bacterium]|nr:hypothetical protein [Oscillospiraceae bacterium]